MNVLQVIPALETGGAERTTLDVAAHLVKAGGTAIVASTGGRMVEELEACGALFEKLPVASKNPVTLWRNIGRLSQLIRKYNITLVHARSRAPAWSAYFAAKRCNIPFVTTYHGTYRNSGTLKHYYNSIMTRSVKVIANSNFIAERISQGYGLSADKIAIIPRGSDFAALTPGAVPQDAKDALAHQWGLAHDKRHVILLPGRLSRWKGQEVLIQAAEKLMDLGRDDFVCILAGDSQGRDAYEADLRRAIKNAHLDGIVRIVGHCSTMPSAYALADIVVSASTRAEAFGRVAVEAQAMEVPVVVSDHGGARETVANGKTGWRVTPGDPTALARALDATLSLAEDARHAFGLRGRAHVLKTYSVNTMCAKTLAVYTEILKN